MSLQQIRLNPLICCRRRPRFTMHSDYKTNSKPLSQKEFITVLMVEDSYVDAFMLNHLLEGSSPRYDFYFTISTTMKDAFERLDRGNFDVAILDLNLPDMSGLACINALKTHAPNLPVIVYSATDNTRATQDALKCGARGYLVKGRSTSQKIQSIIESVIKSTACV